MRNHCSKELRREKKRLKRSPNNELIKKHIYIENEEINIPVSEQSRVEQNEMKNKEAE